MVKVVANSILLALFGSGNNKGNEYFNSLRILEDCYYQALLRQELENYIWNVTGDSINDLSDDLNFYVRYGTSSILSSQFH